MTELHDEFEVICNDFGLSYTEFARQSVEFSLRAQRSLMESFLCVDCTRDTGRIGEYYMVHDDIWNSVVTEGDGMLCITCLETRLGRELTKRDFTDVPLNNLSDEWTKSPTLINRLTRG